MKHKTTFWLYDSQRKHFINEISDFRDLCVEKVIPLFENPNKQADEYEKELWSEVYESPPCGIDGEMVDPSELYADVQAQAFRRYQLLRIMSYRTIAMWLSCAYQMWEQQCKTFVIQECKNNRIRYTEKDVRNDKWPSAMFKRHGIDFESFHCWDKLHELDLLVNTFKHSEGRSEKELQQKRPEIFIKANQYLGNQALLNVYHTSLLETTIYLTQQDFFDYCNAIVEFWNELPNQMVEVGVQL